MLTAVLVGCPADANRGSPAARRDLMPVSVDEPPPGFATVMLVTTVSPPSGSRVAADTPAGRVWYRLASAVPPRTSTLSLEWYVQAVHLQPGRAYRIDVTVDGHSIYSVGNGRADASGKMTAHGILPRFADQYCVSTPTVPQSLAGQHALSVAVKSDGAGTGSASAGSPLTDPGREFPCDGNGDGQFDYWLGTDHPFTIGGASGDR
jgi:hypothetical protein